MGVIDHKPQLTNWMIRYGIKQKLDVGQMTQTTRERKVEDDEGKEQ